MPYHAPPLIGITGESLPPGGFSLSFPLKHVQRYTCLDSAYSHRVRAVGGIPVIIPSGSNQRECDALLDNLDGIVLTGDQEQATDNGQVTEEAAQGQVDNDLMLIHRIIARRVPLLAIGSGMQRLNFACGGSHSMQLSDHQPRALAHAASGSVICCHAVLIEEGSRLNAIYRGREIRVNSCHHQAIRRVGYPLRVAGRASDGIIEAVEATDWGWFCLGVQWHPEVPPSSPLDECLFLSLVEASGKVPHVLTLAA